MFKINKTKNMGIIILPLIISNLCFCGNIFHLWSSVDFCEGIFLCLHLVFQFLCFSESIFSV